MMDIIGTAQLMLDSLGANKTEFLLSIVLLFPALARNSNTRLNRNSVLLAPRLSSIN